MSTDVHGITASWKQDPAADEFGGFDEPESNEHKSYGLFIESINPGLIQNANNATVSGYDIRIGNDTQIVSINGVQVGESSDISNFTRGEVQIQFNNQTFDADHFGTSDGTGVFGF